jgi:hypothetical protein
MYQRVMLAPLWPGWRGDGRVFRVIGVQTVESASIYLLQDEADLRFSCWQPELWLKGVD